MKKRTICAALLLAMLTALPVAAQMPTAPQEGPRAAPTARIESGALPVLDTTPKLDVEAATNGYLAQVQGEARTRSDAYAEGGAWLTLFHLLYGLAIAGVLMGLGLSARLRDWAEERTHSRTYQAMIYGAIMVTAVALLSLPLALYECYFREQAYGLSNQSLARWAGDFGLVFLLTLAVTVPCLPIFYAVIRAAHETWWVWGGGLAILFLIVQLIIAPVFIAPLFNDHAPLPDGPLKTKIAALAAANQISAGDINVSDASRQSNRISAHLSGFLGTARITLSDNLLRNGSEDEVLAVVGHEIGHYVMGHTTRAILLQGLLVLLGFGFAAWLFPIAADFFGGIWQVRRVDDIASLPALAALLGLFAFLVMPASHSISRTAERQADLYAFNAARKPDAFATLLLKLAPHRKLEPGNLEEAVFYRHPSARSRIETAMAWKAQHIADADIREMAGPGVIAP
jgi:STE24 endopeptidase